MYKIKDRQTLPIFEDLMPFGGKVDTNNRWFQYEKLIPWRELENEYSLIFARTGRPAHDARLIMGAYIIRLMLGLSNEDVEYSIRENPYMQYFCGFEEFKTGLLFDPKILNQLKIRFGVSQFERFDLKVRNILKENKILYSSFNNENILNRSLIWIKNRFN